MQSNWEKANVIMTGIALIVAAVSVWATIVIFGYQNQPKTDWYASVYESSSPVNFCRSGEGYGSPGLTGFLEPDLNLYFRLVNIGNVPIHVYGMVLKSSCIPNGTVYIMTGGKSSSMVIQSGGQNTI